MKDGASVATRNVLLVCVTIVVTRATNKPSEKFHNHGEAWSTDYME